MRLFFFYKHATLTKNSFMKYLLFLLIIWIIFESCGKIYPQKSISYGVMPKRIERDSITATIKHCGNKKFDSLFVVSKNLSLKLAIPHSDSIRFAVKATSKFGIFLQNKSRTKELVFSTRDSSWSRLKNRDFRGYGPH